MPASIAGGPRLSAVTISNWLTRRFYIRLHMTVMIALTICAGIAATNLLLLAQVRNIAWRYGLAVTASYAAFLALIRLWLWYVGIQTARAESRSGVDFSSDGIDVAQLVADLRPGIPSTSFDSGGGSFGGGGATGSWGDVAETKSSSGGGMSFGLDIDDDSGTLLLVIAIVVAVIIAIAAAFYLIYAAPAILSEVALQAVLAAAVARRTRTVSNFGWMMSVFAKTIWIFLAVAAAAVAVGLVAHHVCPDAPTLAQALHCKPL